MRRGNNSTADPSAKQSNANAGRERTIMTHLVEALYHPDARPSVQVAAGKLKNSRDLPQPNLIPSRQASPEATFRSSSDIAYDRLCLNLSLDRCQFHR